MAGGKRWREWEQIATLSRVTLWPHMSKADRQGKKLEIIPPDLMRKARGKSSAGMNKAELKAMRGAFKNVETVSASDVRIRPQS